VLHLPAGLTMRSAAGRAAAGRTFAAAARPGVVTVTDYANTGNRSSSRTRPYHLGRA